MLNNRREPAAGDQHSSERRRGKRRPRRLRVKVLGVEEVSSDHYFLESRDVSPEGMFLSTDLLPRVGAALKVEVDLPGLPRPLAVSALVVRASRTLTGLGPGVGVRLLPLSAQEQAALLGGTARYSTSSL
jgi:hypothetical protein